MKIESKSIGKMIAILHRRAHAYFEPKLAVYNLGRGTPHFLIAIARMGTATPHELSRDLHIDRANTTRAIQKLLDRGLVKKESCPTDARTFRLSLTEKGEEIVPEIKKILIGWMEKLTEGFSEKEIEMTQTLMEKLIANAVNSSGEVDEK